MSSLSFSTECGTDVSCGKGTKEAERIFSAEKFSSNAIIHLWLVPRKPENDKPGTCRVGDAAQRSAAPFINKVRFCFYFFSR